MKSQARRARKKIAMSKGSMKIQDEWAKLPEWVKQRVRKQAEGKDIPMDSKKPIVAEPIVMEVQYEVMPEV